MSDLSIYNEYGPITWYKRKPVYLTAFITAGFVLGMIATVFIRAANWNPMALAFAPYEFWEELHLWQLVTYPLLAGPSFFFAFCVLIFYWVGVGTERYLGRPRYVRLLVLLTLLSPAIQSLLWLMGKPYNLCAGGLDIFFGTFIACATLYPNMDYFWGIALKWWAIAGTSILALIDIDNHDKWGLLMLAVIAGTAFGYVRYFQTAGEMPDVLKRFFAKFRRKPKFKVVPREITAQEELHESIDPLLDKIAKSGLSSLTAKERARLEQASKTLKKKD